MSSWYAVLETPQGREVVPACCFACLSAEGEAPDEFPQGHFACGVYAGPQAGETEVFRAYCDRADAESVAKFAP